MWRSCRAPRSAEWRSTPSTRPNGTGVHVDRLDVAGFGSVVKQVRSLGEDPSALVAEFPGCDGAITAVHGEALPGGHRWRTWHLYPDARGGGEVVSTSSSWRMGATR